MSAAIESAGGSRWERLDKSQLIKWTVYSLLLLNWGYYAIEEFYIASHVLREGGTVLEWMEEFATTIDEFAWFGLLFMFELETYALEDHSMHHRRVRWSIHGFRLICYVFLAHTVYARIATVNDTFSAPAWEGVTQICELADQDVSYGKNYRYTVITSENCSTLGTGGTLTQLSPSVVTDAAGYQLEQQHTLVDLVDAITWLLVIWAIELAVWLQNRGVTGGWLMIASHSAKAFYTILFLDAAFWIYAGHWVYAWDQCLWICGFWAIEHNLSEWRDEIREEEGTHAQGQAPGNERPDKAPA